MRAPSAGELLDVWEAGFTQTLTERALSLLAVACPDVSWDRLAELSIGQRDAQLLYLRERLWGPRLAAVVGCPQCREGLELTLDSREMLAGSQTTHGGDGTASIDGYKVVYRLPNSLDFMPGLYQDEPEQEEALLQRCLRSVEQDGVVIVSHTLPEKVVEAVAHSMAEADPLADVQLSLACPACDHKWRSVFDIVSFMWAELEVWAWRILSDVHTLARAYNWHERDILSLSPTRRQFYLEMVGA